MIDGFFEVSVWNGLGHTQRSAVSRIQFRVDEPGHFTMSFIEDAGATWGGPYRLRHGDYVILAAHLYFVALNDGGPSGIRISDFGFGVPVAASNQVVTEPSSLILCSFGIAGVLAYGQRRQCSD